MGERRGFCQRGGKHCILPGGGGGTSRKLARTLALCRRRRVLLVRFFSSSLPALKIIKKGGIEGNFEVFLKCLRRSFSRVQPWCFSALVNECWLPPLLKPVETQEGDVKGMRLCRAGSSQTNRTLRAVETLENPGEPRRTPETCLDLTGGDGRRPAHFPSHGAVFSVTAGGSLSGILLCSSFLPFCFLIILNLQL